MGPPGIDIGDFVQALPGPLGESLPRGLIIGGRIGIRQGRGDHHMDITRDLQLFLQGGFVEADKRVGHQAQIGGSAGYCFHPR